MASASRRGTTSAFFERYQRASNVPGRIAGTGIGLSYVREIVEQHGGHVIVNSVQDQGSTFTIRLPLAKEAQE